MAKLTGSITIHGGNADFTLALHKDVEDGDLQTADGVAEVVRAAVRAAVMTSPHVAGSVKIMADQATEIEQLKAQVAELTELPPAGDNPDLFSDAKAATPPVQPKPDKQKRRGNRR